MNFTEKAKSKFWSDLSEGIMSAFGHKLGESLHIDHYKTGRFTFTESVTGGPGAVTLIMDKLKASSPVIESVCMTPISTGYNATYNVSVKFDPVKAESVYSDGKDNIRTIEKNGKTYIVDPDGTAHPIEGSGDEFVDNFNKSTGSRYQKKSESNLDADGFPIDLDSVVALANEALDGTGVSVAQENGSLVIRGETDTIKPTQQYLPVPSYDMDSIEGGYDDETGDLSVSVPNNPSEIELEQLREFLVNAVNYIIDNTLCQSSDTCSDDEWCKEMATAEPNEKYATQYSYKGDSFVGESKHKVAVLVKSLLNESRIDEAKQVATKYMGAEMAEGFVRKYAVEKVEEHHKVVLPDDMALLDRMHDTAVNRAPEKVVEMDALVAKNMFKH